MSKSAKATHIFQTVFLVSISFYLSIGLFTCGIWLQIGGKFVMTAYFIVLYLGLLVLGIYLYKKYSNPTAISVRILYLGGIGYMFERVLIPEIMFHRPVAYVFTILSMLALVSNLIFSIYMLVNILINAPGRGAWRTSWKNKLIPKMGVALILWLCLLGWSYVGFSTSVTISDPYIDSPCPMRVSFYGMPYGRYNPEYYSTPEWDIEAEYYQDMGSVFTVPWSRALFMPNSSDRLANRTTMFHALEGKGLQFMLCLGPYNPTAGEGDFFTYYYCEEMNRSIDECVQWVEDEGFTNFFGIQIDPEGPRFEVDNEGRPQIINASQHTFAARSTQNKINEFKAAHPEWLFTTVSVMAAFYDWADGDWDNDIMLKSISAEPLIVDYYGWQTYMVQQDRKAPSEYHEKLRMAKARYGSKLSPWIGWYNDGDGDNYADSPELHANTLTQIKICKSLEVEELFIAASYRYFPYYHEDLSNFESQLALLGDLNRTRNEPFETFRLPYTQDPSLYRDPFLWWDKISPWHFIADENIFLDLYCELQFEWLFWYELVQAAVIIMITKRNGKRLIGRDEKAVKK